MKRKRFFLTLVAPVFLFFGASVVGAADVYVVDAGDSRTEALISLSKKGLGFGAGVLSGLVIHEGSHELAATIVGVDLDWNGTKSTFSEPTSASKKTGIALAGFIGQGIASEVVLGWDKIPKDNSFVLGLMAWNILEPVSYLIRHEISNDGYGDLRTVDRNGLDARIVEGVIVGHALLCAWRLWSKKEVPLYIRGTLNEFQIGFSWRW